MPFIDLLMSKLDLPDRSTSSNRKQAAAKPTTATRSVAFPHRAHRTNKISVQRISRFHWKTQFRSTMKMPFPEWFYVVSGSGHLEQANHYHRLVAGTIVCSDRGIVRKLWCEGDDELLVNILALNACDETTERLADAMGAATIAYMATNGPAICGIFDAMIQCAANHEPLAYGICNTYLYPLLLTIKQGRLFRETETNQKLSTYYRCQRYIDEHFAETASVEEVADANAITPEHLCRLFKLYGGTSPHQYLLALKMNLAQTRLQTRDIPLKQIAHELGFSNASSFSKAFKRLQGVSPSDLRKPSRP